MADDPKVIRGSLGGVTVQASAETIALLGSDFEPEPKKATAKKTTASKPDNKS